jgi:glycosyltransferase involved in cell wall biosynthesis
MRVALDGTPLAVSSGGLRRYTEELIRALRLTCPDDEFLIVPPEGPLWWSLRLPLRTLAHDVFHGTNFEVPYLPLRPSVMTVHDLSPWMQPEWHSGAGRVRSRCPVLVRLGIATLIITPTNAVRRQVLGMFGAHPDRVAVVPEAARMRRVEVPPQRPFILFAGTIEPRKNVPGLIAAWRPLRHRADLVIAGRARDDAPRIEAEAGLTLAGEVSDEHLAELYSGATIFVYPSAYEGFGLPVLEAMSCGTPVIATRDPALTEIAGGAALHSDLDGLTSAIEMLLDNHELRSRLAEAGLRRARQFTWERTAGMTREVYAEAILRHRTLA